jgi:predicted PurR-regulated permease PerM
LLTTQPAPGRSARTALAGLAALGSVVAASSCCLPILPFVFAAGAAGSSAVLTAMRPYLLGVSVACIAYGFYQAWRAKQCRRRPNVLGTLSTLLLWISASVVALSLFFPQVIAEAAADLLAR